MAAAGGGGGGGSGGGDGGNRLDSPQVAAQNAASLLGHAQSLEHGPPWHVAVRSVLGHAHERARKPTDLGRHHGRRGSSRPSGRGTRSIQPGQALSAQIRRGLHGCRLLVALLSENIPRSKWCKLELLTALERPESECGVLPVWWTGVGPSETPAALKRRSGEVLRVPADGDPKGKADALAVVLWRAYSSVRGGASAGLAGDMGRVRAALEAAAGNAEWPYAIKSFGATAEDLEDLEKKVPGLALRQQVHDELAEMRAELGRELDRMREEQKREDEVDVADLVHREVERRLEQPVGGALDHDSCSLLARLLGETAARYAVEDRGPQLCQSSPAAGAMYRRVRLKLGEVLLAHKVLASGLVQGVQSLKVKLLVGAVELVGGRLLGALMEGAVRWLGGVAESASRGVDFAAKGGVAAGAAAEHVAELQRQVAVERASAAEGAPTVANLEGLAEAVAYRLAVRYRWHAARLGEAGAATLGECAVRRVAKFMDSGFSEADHDALRRGDVDVETLLVRSVYLVSMRQGFAGVFRHRFADAGEKAEGWSEDGVFERSGFELADGRRWTCVRTASDQEKYGFIHAHNEAEVKARGGMLPL